MKARFIHKSYLILVFASVLLATNATDEEIESITGTREPDDDATTETAPAVATTTKSVREARWYRPLGQERGDYSDHDDHDDHIDALPDDHDHDMKAMAEPKGGDYFGGYYDFLINEGSYKFWAVFQLGTAALLIYSGFAALYYAKVNPTTDTDYDDYFLRRRRSADRPPQERSFLGLTPEAFQRIIDAVAREYY